MWTQQALYQTASFEVLILIYFILNASKALKKPINIKAIAVHNTMVMAPNAGLNKMSIAKIMVIIPPIVSTHDLPVNREKLNNESPRNKNQMPIIMRSIVTLAAICPISTIPNITSNMPRNKCQPRFVELRDRCTCNSSAIPASKIIKPNKNPKAA